MDRLVDRRKGGKRGKIRTNTEIVPAKHACVGFFEEESEPVDRPQLRRIR